MKETIQKLITMANKITKKSNEKKSDYSKDQSVKKSKSSSVDVSNLPEFIKKNKVTGDFFKFKGITYRTSDGKKYNSIQEFASDGGDWHKIQVIK